METLRIRANHYMYGVAGPNSYEVFEGQLVNLPLELAQLFIDCSFAKKYTVEDQAKEEEESRQKRLEYERVEKKYQWVAKQIELKEKYRNGPSSQLRERWIEMVNSILPEKMELRDGSYLNSSRLIPFMVVDHFSNQAIKIESNHFSYRITSHDERMVMEDLCRAIKRMMHARSKTDHPHGEYTYEQIREVVASTVNQHINDYHDRYEEMYSCL